MIRDGYPVYEIGPQFNFESGDTYSSYECVGVLTLDETISRVYYQTITSEEQWDFFIHYLKTGYLSGYDVSEKENCTLIWSAAE